MGSFSRLLKGSDDPYDKYTYDWLKRSPEKELEDEREKIRLCHCSGDGRAIHHLDAIDQEKSRRYKASHLDSEPGYPVHREHGWYPPNDD